MRIRLIILIVVCNFIAKGQWIFTPTILPQYFAGVGPVKVVVKTRTPNIGSPVDRSVTRNADDSFTISICNFKGEFFMAVRDYLDTFDLGPLAISVYPLRIDYSFFERGQTCAAGTHSTATFQFTVAPMERSVAAPR